MRCCMQQGRRECGRCERGGVADFTCSASPCVVRRAAVASGAELANARRRRCVARLPAMVGHGTALLFLLARSMIMAMVRVGGRGSVAQSLCRVRRSAHGCHHSCGHGGACQATQDQQHHQEQKKAATHGAIIKNGLDKTLW